MDKAAIETAARLLAEARRGGQPIAALPAAARPGSVGDAHAVQEATVALLGEEVAGWKVGFAPDGEVMRGAILASRLLESPARIAAASVPLLGIEAEIAFRFERPLPPRGETYSAEEVAQAVTALVGIEIVDSRFASYRDAPLLDRTADFMSNGAFIVGTVKPDWRRFDLAGLTARLEVNGRVLVEKTGGHPTRDPILPAIALVNALRVEGGVAAGRIITTGTYTGLHFAQSGDEIVAAFEGFGTASLKLDA
jgi:2-keto-4-pentenoate hydratase